MNINKDEARILAAALGDLNYSTWINQEKEKENAVKIANSILQLQNKLKLFSMDERRIGRTSRNDFDDLLYRFAKISKYKKY